MFDYAQRLQLALGDVVRRSALKVIAGVVLAVAVGFLLAALWSWLAHGLGWGATMASLAIGGGFVVIGAIILMVASRERHPMPTGDDLRREVEARASLAADAAVNRVQAEALRVADMAENKVHSLIDHAGFRANKLASDTERRAQEMFRGAAGSIGLTGQNIGKARNRAAGAARQASRAADSDAGNMAKLIGAFAVGVTLAAKLQERRRSRSDFDDADFL
ncbi:phage holin family protein [Paracoccus stylophorae]|uniref:Phage holin family protein n=1 Tax=Paracoccus stylophorae TaxID=659350 RepID=A0ABY7SYB1_9RHOB|nr:phage holin family protein [Paracoccus stylophorae]WCR11904.1 phage holin family protein [Paracoccus stylophorae]